MIRVSQPPRLAHLLLCSCSLEPRAHTRSHAAALSILDSETDAYLTYKFVIFHRPLQGRPSSTLLLDTAEVRGFDLAS